MTAAPPAKEEQPPLAGAHWTEPPSIHARIAHHIPQERLKTCSWSCALMLRHFLFSARGRM